MKQKSMNIWNWHLQATEHKNYVMCPNCGTWFDKPDWHYCKCPNCLYYLWDERT